MQNEAQALRELADRVEAATGPDRELDARVRAAVHDDFAFCGDEGSTCAACMMGLDTTQFPDCGAPLGMVDERSSHPSRWQDDDHLPAYTASLDAAMTLLDGVGVLIGLSDIGADGLPLARVGVPSLPHAPVLSGIASCIMTNTSPVAGLALALTAAALRARASLIEGTSHDD